LNPWILQEWFNGNKGSASVTDEAPQPQRPSEKGATEKGANEKGATEKGPRKNERNENGLTERELQERERHEKEPRTVLRVSTGALVLPSVSNRGGNTGGGVGRNTGGGWAKNTGGYSGVNTGGGKETSEDWGANTGGNTEGGLTLRWRLVLTPVRGSGAERRADFETKYFHMQRYTPMEEAFKVAAHPWINLHQGNQVSYI